MGELINLTSKRLDATNPRPWFVASYSMTALGRVMRSDFNAIRTKDRQWRIGSETIDVVTDYVQLCGINGGTLYLLLGTQRYEKLDDIIHIARKNNIEVRLLV